MVRRLPTTGIFNILSVNQPELKFPLTHMLFLIRFSVFQKNRIPQFQ
ncbi:hypothetical protein ECDEC6B_4831 [Escherichia coli DEC6B]|nr:hypothetical protein ECDEC6B_4831 [Escherichia coli DEC6B]